MAKKQKILLFCKLGNAAADRRGKQVRAWAESQGYSVVDVTHSEGTLSKDALQDVVLGVVVGGDGTLLTLARRLENKDHFPLVGINLGSLGFFTEFQAEECIVAVEQAMNGQCREHRRHLLRVEVCQGDACRATGTVLNDAVLSKDAQTPMLKFDVFLGEEHLAYYRADGYIISTPTGSTAYGLSVGGPLLHPAVDSKVVLPICSHSLSARPVVVPWSTVVTVRPRSFQGKVYLVLDGQISHELSQNDTVRVHPSGESLRLMGSARHTWSDTLRQKLEMR